MSRKLWFFLGGVAILFSVYIYLMVDGSTTRNERLKLAQSAAMQYLLHPSAGTIKISGNRLLVDGCVDPRLETTYALSEKGRFEFRVHCTNKATAFMLVAMRQYPPDFIAIYQMSMFGENTKTGSDTN